MVMFFGVTGRSESDLSWKAVFKGLAAGYPSTFQQSLDQQSSVLTSVVAVMVYLFVMKVSCRKEHSEHFINIKVVSVIWDAVLSLTVCVSVFVHRYISGTIMCLKGFIGRWLVGYALPKLIFIDYVSENAFKNK